jgi:hypothetical protein
MLRCVSRMIFSERRKRMNHKDMLLMFSKAVNDGLGDLDFGAFEYHPSRGVIAVTRLLDKEVPCPVKEKDTKVKAAVKRKSNVKNKTLKKKKKS